MLITLRKTLLIGALTAFSIPGITATVGGDGGVTLWLSYDDSAAGPIDIDSSVNVVDSTTAASCGATDTGRSGVGAAASSGQCPGGATSCTGREKITGDLNRFAEYVFQATEGATYIRRVYVADEGRSWDNADVRYDLTGAAGSTGAGGGWDDVGRQINLRSSERRCIHDVLHHEFGHYFHNLPDRYRSDESNGYYRGTLNGSAIFDVGVEERDINTVMSNNFPHQFVDTTNARIAIEYDPPGAVDVNHPPGEVLTPDLLTDADPNNDGPDRAHHGHTHPFAQDEWSRIPLQHVHLSGVHTEGSFPAVDLTSMPPLDIVFIGDDAAPPGTMLVLDRSGSMAVQTDGIPASQYVQEAGLYLHHSSQDDDFVGTLLYNDTVETLFDYELYDPSNDLPQASFRAAQGLTNIALSLQNATDALIAEHGEGGVNGANIVLMSDGRQTVGSDLWLEVDRASQLGIRINTISFGSADETVMAQIATDTGGDQTDAAERSDAFELKMGMAHEFSEIRGYTPIYSLKEQLKRKGFQDDREVYEDQFVVPPFSRHLLFYSHLRGGDASLFDLELTDPSGNVISTVTSTGSITTRGRFNGLKSSKPEPGVWTYKLMSTEKTDFVIPSDEPFELTAYTRTLPLSASIGLTRDTDRKGFVRVLGNVSFRYPLTNLKARANIYRGGDTLGWIELFDDGKNGGDDHAGDGEFSGLLPVSRFGLNRPFGNGERKTKTRIDAQFLIGDKAIPAPNAHYETGTDIERLNDDYNKNGKSRLPFQAWATSTFDFESDPNADDVGIRVIEPQDQIKMKPGDRDKLVVQLRGIQPRKDTLRYSLGQGIDIELLDIRTSNNQFGGVVTFGYSVGKDAVVGSRTLLVQSGNQIVQQNHVLFVTD